MKTLLSPLLIFTLANLTIAQTTAIPDANFEQELINLGLDATTDGQVLTANIDTLTSLDVSFKTISDLTGIEDFVSLTALGCGGNQLTNIDVTQNTALIYFYCSNNQLTSIDVTQNLSLTAFHCDNNLLTSIDVTQNISLDDFWCNNNLLSSLNITQNPDLIYLYCSNNPLTSLDVTQNTLLQDIHCISNQLTSLNVTQNTALKWLDCTYNQLISIDLSQNVSLIWLKCYYNQLAELDISQCPVFNTLYSYNNSLTCLNLKNGNNINFFDLNTSNNSSLSCIEVDNVSWATSNWTYSNGNIDAASSFSTNCGNACSVGINEISLSNLSLYPNPTTGNITIDLGEVYQDVKATLTNSLGQVVLSQNYNSTAFIYLDLDYPKGLYFLTLETNGEVISKKIIKQ